VLAALIVSLTDFDLYALADIRNLRFVGSHYRHLLHAPDFWRALPPGYFVAVGVPLSLALAGERAAGELAAAYLAASFVPRFRAGGNDPGGRGGRCGVICCTPAMDCSTTRWLTSAFTRSTGWRSALGAAGRHPVRGVEELRLQTWSFSRRAAEHSRRTCTSAARLDGASLCRSSADHAAMLTSYPAAGEILTVAGYFQLFAEPYVMTQGGPLQSPVSVLYFMYEKASSA